MDASTSTDAVVAWRRTRDGRAGVVDVPWESTAPTLTQILDRTTALLSEFQKDARGRGAEFKSYTDAEAREQERAVTACVARALGGRVLSDRYEFKGLAPSDSTKEGKGDVDGIVYAHVSGKDVLVFVEAKHNVDGRWSQAVKELDVVEGHWFKLKALEVSAMSGQQLADYNAMGLDRYHEAEVWCAVGGTGFSEEKQRYAANGKGWLVVSPITDGYQLVDSSLVAKKHCLSMTRA
jgi:hypothetical protein